MEDPGRPIPPETTAVHHITDEMVRGKRMNLSTVFIDRERSNAELGPRPYTTRAQMTLR